LISGTEKVSSYDPMTGKLQWEGEGTCPVTCGTLVWSDNLVFASGGFPIKKTIAMRADGSGEIVWENGDKSYEQSLLYHDGHLYTFNDNGIAICWNAETGEEKWKVRLGGPVSASPILANGLIHAINERGITHVFRPNPAAFEKVGEFQVGDEGFATPVFVGNQIFIRTAEQGAHRQEFLYCISEE
jgi:outer membrane protein assembly factor BamB